VAWRERLEAAWERVLASLSYDFSQGEPAGAAPQLGGPDPIVSRDYENLRRAPQALRQALVDVSRELQIDPAELSDIIQSESGWDPTQPKAQTGTPRAGLLQLTVGAHQPGFETADAVWALREVPGDVQLRKVFLPFLKALKLPPKADAYRIYKSVFLPRFANKPDDFAICDVHDERTEDDKWCVSNPGFDRNKDGRIQWLEVFERVNEVRRSAKGRFLTLSGKVVEQGESVPASIASEGPAPARAVLQLRNQIDAQWRGRPKASDGIMGDLAHRARESDHNQGNAIDITRGPGGPDTRALIPLLLQDPRTRYVIHESKIYNPSIGGGAARAYEGPGKDPHNRHLHLSIHAERRDDNRPWEIEGVPTLDASPEASDGHAAVAIREGLLKAWKAGWVDNIVWVPLQFTELVLTVSAEFLSVDGVRIPCSWAEELELCRANRWVPATVAVVERRWELADRRLVVTPSPPERLNSAEGVAQVLKVNAALPPVAPAVLAEGFKHWVLDDAKIARPTNFGLYRADGSVWQQKGHGHDAAWRDYSQMFAPVQREAELGGKTIDLLERARQSGKYDAAVLDFLEGK